MIIKKYKHYIVLLMDIIIVYISFFFAIFVKDSFLFEVEHYVEMSYEIPLTIILYIIFFEIFGMYKSLWKYASIEEFIRGVVANIAAINISYLILLAIGVYHFNYSYYLIAFFFTATGTLGMRLSYRLLKFYRSYVEDVSHKSRTLIVGAGQGGVTILDEIKSNKDFNMVAIGFLDDNPDLQGKQIRGINVLGPISKVCDIALREKINTIVLAIPSLSYNETKTILNRLDKTGVKIKMMPPLYEMLDTKQDVFKVRDVRIEDLLGREEISLDITGINDYVNNKTVLVTGGGGSIGSELVRQLRVFNPSKIVVLDIYENNVYALQQELVRLYKNHTVEHKPEIVVLIASVRDYNRMSDIFMEHKPNVVFHAAAHKHVPLMEDSPSEAVKNNVFGTYNVALISHENDVEKFVLISTDKAVNPTNIMGATKRLAEKIIISFNQISKTEYAAVRFGNVLGSNGSVIPLFKEQIKEGGPVTVTHPDIIRYFMTIPEACQLVIQAGAYAKGGELFVLDMGNPVKIVDLAIKMIKLVGLEPFSDIQIEFTGLRPGEKMYEELLIDVNKTKKTNNSKIFIENSNGYSESFLQEILDFRKEIRDLSFDLIIDRLKYFVDTFKHNQ